jgi:hypothetical protein
MHENLTPYRTGVETASTIVDIDWIKVGAWQTTKGSDEVSF